MDIQIDTEVTEIAEKVPTTEEIVAGMMKENTGRHFLDSGGAYGRHWERNQTRDFGKEERASVSFKYKEINVSINLYHWLVDRLRYSHRLQKLWDEWHNLEMNERTPDIGLMEGFPEFLESKGWSVSSVWGNRDKNIPFIENSYNGDCSLSQTIQWGAFRAESPEDEEDWFDDEVIMMSVHGGCDVRGGYSDVKIFTPYNEWTAVACYNDAVIYCTDRDCGASWYTDSGNRWYPSDREGELDRKMIIESDSDESPGGPKIGVIYVDVENDHTAYCPECGKGKLRADFN